MSGAVDVALAHTHRHTHTQAPRLAENELNTQLAFEDVPVSEGYPGVVRGVHHRAKDARGELEELLSVDDRDLEVVPQPRQPTRFK